MTKGGDVAGWEKKAPRYWTNVDCEAALAELARERERSKALEEAGNALAGQAECCDCDCTLAEIRAWEAALAQGR